jgi:hypothetical protein
VELEGYSFSGDERKMMIESAVEPIYRYSYLAYHYIYDRASRKLVPLSDPAKPKQRWPPSVPMAARPPSCGTTTSTWWTSRT